MRIRSVLFGAVLAAGFVGGAAPAGAGGGGACRDGAPAVPTAATTVAMVHSCFEPGVVTVRPGETVELVNDDPMLHNLYGPGWFHGDVPAGGVARRTFEDEGTFAFACTLHPGMAGAVVVSEAGLSAAPSTVTGADGGASRTLVMGTGLSLAAGVAAGWALSRRRTTLRPAR